MDASLRLPIARLARTPRAWVAIVGWMLAAVVSAAILHRRGTSATEAALGSVFGSFALPLLAFAVVGAVLGGESLGRACRSLVAFGAPPAKAALSATVASIGAAALLAALSGSLVAVVAHGPLDPPVVHDALTTAWVSGLGGAAYAALFTFGATFGRHGWGRVAALFVDWLFGGGTGVVASCLPRAHVRSLLGGEAVVSLGERASAAALVALVVAFTLLAVARARRA
jgi:hypothetical protein